MWLTCTGMLYVVCARVWCEACSGEEVVKQWGVTCQRGQGESCGWASTAEEGPALRVDSGCRLGGLVFGETAGNAVCADRIRMPECSRASEETESRGSVVGGSWCWTRLLGQLRPRASEFQGACVDSHERLLCLQVPEPEAHPWGSPWAPPLFTVLGPAGWALPRAGSSVLWTPTWTLGGCGHSLNPR